jgi:hypothetical protein
MPKLSEQCSKHSRALPEANAPVMLGDAPRNAHTDRQTYKHLTTLASYLTLGNARRGVARFLAAGDENSRPASAARGLIGANHA